MNNRPIDKGRSKYNGGLEEYFGKLTFDLIITKIGYAI